MSPRFEIPDAGEAQPLKDIAAEANTCWEWIRNVATKIGLTVVCIEISREDFINKCPALGVHLESELKLSMFDSIQTGDPTRFFFHASSERLAEALQEMRTALEKISEAVRTYRIGYADAEAKCWRTVIEAK
jgi:hypothetical protein